LISESATTAPHGLYNTGTNTVTLGASVTSGVAYTASAFVKKVTGNIDWIQILLGTGGFGSQYANFNLTTGQFGNVSGLTTRVEEHANGWYRISVTRNATVTTSTTATFGVNFINNTNGTTSGPSYAGSTSNQFLLTMCQFEAGSFPTSYIPTTTGSVVRSADVCSITGANFTSFYNSTSGTLLSEASIANLIGNNRGIVQVDNGTNESILRHLYSFGDGGFRSLIRAGGDTPTVLSTILGTASTIQKRIIAYEGTSFASVTNGGAVATATRTMPTGLNAMRIGNLTDGSFYLSGHVAAIRFYKKRLPNAKLVTLTT
jgi:hypothetical protein